jgi:hypothetical protein
MLFLYARVAVVVVCAPLGGAVKVEIAKTDNYRDE